jgi:hypothetical protein
MGKVARLAGVSWVLLFQAACGGSAPVRSPRTPVIWNIDGLSAIGGHVPVVEGVPRVVETDRGRAVEFGGTRDGLEVPALPLAGEREFTLEIVFRPDADGPAEQRFLHLQEDASASRFLIETRVLPGGKWYLDTYIETEIDRCTLVDAAKVHPAGVWHSAALSYDGRTMRHYVDGREELSRELKFRPLGPGRTSIGMRLNRVHWFKGAVRTVRFTPRALPPPELLRP